MKVAADWASDWAADWVSDSTHFNRLKVDFRKNYFQLFLRYFSLQISVIISNTTYLFTADGKLRKHGCSFVREITPGKDTTYYVSTSLRLIHKFGDKPVFEVHAQGTKTILYGIFSALSIDVGYFVARALKVMH